MLLWGPLLTYRWFWLKSDGQTVHLLVNLFLCQCASPGIYKYWFSIACTHSIFASLEFFSLYPSVYSRLVCIIIWIFCYSEMLNYLERQQPVLHETDLLKFIVQLFDHINCHGISVVNVIQPKNYASWVSSTSHAVNSAISTISMPIFTFSVV